MPAPEVEGASGGAHPAPVNRSPVRGAQSFVHTLADCWQRPSLLALEVAWRWIFGAPALWLLYREGSRILGAAPLDSTGITGLSFQDPWVAAVILRDTAAVLMPPVLGTAAWLVPLLAVGWSVFSGLGRSLLLRRYDPVLRFAPLPFIALQMLRLIVLGATFFAWFRGIQWAAAATLSGPVEPNLLGYLALVICLSLGVFTAWSLLSWIFSIAPLLVVLEDLPPGRSLLRSLSLGKPLTGKLVEVNLVMGIVKLALIVLAMVFSATPLPFESVVTGDALHLWWVVVTLLYFVASDYFQVARLVAFIRFWKLAASHAL